MTQLLNNPALEWAGGVEYFTDSSGAQIVVEEPRHWKTLISPVDADLTRLPTVLHKDGEGFRIEGGSRAYQAGFGQNVILQAGRQYRLRVTFTPEIYAIGGLSDPYSVKVFIKVGGRQSEDHWLTMVDHHQKQSIAMAFEVTGDEQPRVEMWVHNKWRITNAVVTVHSIELFDETVEVEPEPDDPPVIDPPIVDPPGLPSDTAALLALYVQAGANIAQMQALQGQIVAALAGVVDDEGPKG